MGCSNILFLQNILENRDQTRISIIVLIAIVLMTTLFTTSVI